MENEQNKTLQNSNETEVEQDVGQMSEGNEKNDTYAKINDRVPAFHVDSVVILF